MGVKQFYTKNLLLYHFTSLFIDIFKLIVLHEKKWWFAIYVNEILIKLLVTPF